MKFSEESPNLYLDLQLCANDSCFSGFVKKTQFYLCHHDNYIYQPDGFTLFTRITVKEEREEKGTQK